MQTTIVKWGNSRGIRLPKMLLDSLNLTESDVVDITVENGNIIIRKSESKKHISIQDRFKDFSGEYEPIDIDWGNPEGKELW